MTCGAWVYGLCFAGDATPITVSRGVMNKICKGTGLFSRFQNTTLEASKSGYVADGVDVMDGSQPHDKVFPPLQLTIFDRALELWNVLPATSCGQRYLPRVLLLLEGATTKYVYRRYEQLDQAVATTLLST